MPQVYDYLNTQLIHNQSFAFRLPPKVIEQARGLVNYKETAVFSDKELGGIGNSESHAVSQASEPVTRLSVAGRAILSPIITSLERIAFDDDPLRILLIETSYQPFVSLFSMLNAEGAKGQISGIRAYADESAVFPVLILVAYSQLRFRFGIGASPRTRSRVPRFCSRQIQERH